TTAIDFCCAGGFRGNFPGLGRSLGVSSEAGHESRPRFTSQGRTISACGRRRCCPLGGRRSSRRRDQGIEIRRAGGGSRKNAREEKSLRRRYAGRGCWRKTL